MSAALTPKQYADRVARWRKVGYDYALIVNARLALDDDRRDSTARAPKKTGKLAQTIRVIDPKAGNAARAEKYGRASAGTVRIELAAGSRARGAAAVPYARVLQTGQVYPGRARTKPHEIQALIASRVGSVVPQLRAAGRRLKVTGFKSATGKMLKLRGGNFRTRLMHPGSRFRALQFLAIDEARLIRKTDTGLQAGVNKELG